MPRPPLASLQYGGGAGGFAMGPAGGFAMGPCAGERPLPACTYIRRAKRKITEYKRQDAKRGQQCTITVAWFLHNISGKACVHCGTFERIGVDRRDNSIGHTPENCQPSCTLCNSKSGSRYRHGWTPEEIEARERVLRGLGARVSGLGSRRPRGRARGAGRAGLSD